jgi:hypothetical protein
MTNTVAGIAQSCFTSLMAATKTRRESKYEKAERLVAEGRYAMDPQSSPPEFWVGTCRGDHGNYAVFAFSDEFAAQPFVAHYLADVGIRGGRVGCTCRYGRQGSLCSHAIGAEELRTRGEK